MKRPTYYTRFRQIRRCERRRRRFLPRVPRPPEALAELALEKTHRAEDLRDLAARQAALPTPDYQMYFREIRPGRSIREGYMRAPKRVNFQDNFMETMSFIEELRRLAFVEMAWLPSRRHRTIRMVADLTPIESLTLDAALVIAAEFDRIRRVMRFRPAMEDHGWAAWLRDALNQMGFYDLVNVSKRSGGPAPGIYTFNQRFVKFVSDQQAQPYLANDLLVRLGGAGADMLRQGLADASGDSPERRALYDGVFEAILNARTHAYKLDANRKRVIPHIDLWWAGGSYFPETKQLHVTVYDQGSGIPATMRTNDILKVFQGRDEDKIAQALKFGQTSSDAKGAGNGLWQIANFVELLPGSSVHIYSGSGYVMISEGKKITPTPLPAPFCGTLIHWTINMQGVT